MLQKCSLDVMIMPKRYLSIFTVDRKKEYFARKLIGYSSEEMYSVISDVKNYCKFVPFCTKSTILHESRSELEANLEVGFPPIYENYTSVVTLKKPILVKAVCRDGKLFNYLETTWKLTKGLQSNPRTCIIDFYIKFEFKSSLHSKIATIFFDKLVSQMENAFIAEAKNRFGTQTIPVHQLQINRC